jgi:hypothetical protein
MRLQCSLSGQFNYNDDDDDDLLYQFTGPNSTERQMASTPHSDTIERQWAGYMAAYDVRQQQHMGGNAAGYVADNFPQRFAFAAPMETSFQEIESAPPSDTLLYLHAKMHITRLLHMIKPECVE